jgi:hypothetical protein
VVVPGNNATTTSTKTQHHYLFINSLLLPTSLYLSAMVSMAEQGQQMQHLTPLLLPQALLIYFKPLLLNPRPCHTGSRQAQNEAGAHKQVRKQTAAQRTALAGIETLY